MRKTKALVLLSGGLDSMLAAKLLMEQGIETAGICFKSNFYGCQKARLAAGQLGIELFEVDISEEMADLTKDPPSGHGKNLNPCIDCHALMVKKAGDLFLPSSQSGPLDNSKFNFLATGEVLGQRPFSQNKEALARVLRLGKYEILRPLSAKLLPPTSMEKEGLADRNRLLDISGRSRHRQEELARDFSIKEYPSPAGGCLLTDPSFSKRLASMLAEWPACRPQDIELLKYGRIIWVEFEASDGENDKILMVIGRNKDDNRELEVLAQKGDIVVQLNGIMGPSTIIRFGLHAPSFLQNAFKKELCITVPDTLAQFTDIIKARDPEMLIELAGKLTGYYSVKARGQKADLKIKIKTN